MKKFLFIPALAILVLSSSCSMNVVKGNGHVVSKSFEKSGFKDIEAGSSMNVVLTQGDYSVKIDAEENIMKLIDVHTEGDKLVVGFKNNVNINTSKEIVVYISAPEFRKLDGSGACNFSNKGTIKGRELNLDLSGASNAELTLDVQKLDIDASGASAIKLKGNTIDFSVDGSGSTDVKAFDFIASNVDIGLSGAGEAEVNASKSLKVDLSGAGNVRYKGNPEHLSKELSGAGSVTSVN
jgi:hypothetical protein